MIAPRFDYYDWEGGREAMLRFGPDAGPIAILALPLFEEANRTRTFAVRLLRALAQRDVGAVLPDLPGQGESEMPLADVSLTRMQSAYRGLVDALWGGRRRTYAVGIRSSALLDRTGHVYGRWHLAPQDGNSLLRELTRIRQATVSTIRLGDGWFFDSLDDDGNDSPIDIAGNDIGPALLSDLLGYSPSSPNPTRVVRLTSDPLPADRKIDAAPLWRRVEPGDDPALAAILADDIAEWIATCER